MAYTPAVKISKVDPTMREIIKACFPTYKGRKISVQAQHSPLDVRSCWDGGSRSFYTFYCLATRVVSEVPAQSWFDKQLPGADRVSLPDGIICLQHSIFMGKDSGITFHVNPINMAAMLPSEVAA